MLAIQRERGQVMRIATDFFRQAEPANVAMATLAVVAKLGVMHRLVAIDAGTAACGWIEQTSVMAARALHFVVTARKRQPRMGGARHR